MGWELHEPCIFISEGMGPSLVHVTFLCRHEVYLILSSPGSHIVI